MLEGRIAELLQNQASRFLRGFSADQLRLGLLSGSIELQRLALNPQPIDEILLDMELPLVVKAGVLTSAVVQVSLMQGEAELIIDGLTLVLCPICRWLTKDEVRNHRGNEMQKLEFVHMRSQSQRRNMEHEMFHRLFSDYLSRVKVTIRNVHMRVEIDGKFDTLDPSNEGANLATGFVLGSCEICPVKGVVPPPGNRKNKDQVESQSICNDMLLAETLEIKGLGLYHEGLGSARLLIPSATFYGTDQHALGVFSQIKQDDLVKQMDDLWRQHMSVPGVLMPSTNMSVSVNMRSQPLRVGSHVDFCLTMEVGICLGGDQSRIAASSRMFDHLKWYIRRASNFNIWQFLHPSRSKPSNAKARWAVVRKYIDLKRRLHGNKYTLGEAITMRIHCKQYIFLYKKKFNGPSSVITWRKSLVPISDRETEALADIELMYPAEKVVNFRVMGHAELRTEMALNKCMNMNVDAAGMGEGGNSPYRRAPRELTPLEQLHLHGQNGYGINIYRGLPPPPSSIKIRVDMQIPYGMWWTCRLSGIGPEAAATQRPRVVDDSPCWTLALDCTSQPVRVRLSDNVADTSVFLTVEIPPVEHGQRPLAVLLGRTSSAFSGGSPGRIPGGSSSSGGSGLNEWCSILELEGTVFYCMQIKTMLTSSLDSPWDIFTHFSCGDCVDAPDIRFGERGPAAFDAVKMIDHTGGRSASPFPLNGASQDKSSAGTIESNACIRLRLPLTLVSKQLGPCLALLKQLRAGPKIDCGPLNSTLASLAQYIKSIALAVFRVHVRMPPVTLESVGDGPQCNARWPRFDAACHCEYGGLIDGFVVGLHNLRNFVAAHLLSPGPAVSQQVNGVKDPRNGSFSLSLQPLEQVAPLWLIFNTMATAFGLALASHAEVKQSGQATYQALDKALTTLMRKYELTNILSKVATSTPGPLASLSLAMVALAVSVGRRALWDHQTVQGTGKKKPSTDGCAVVAPIHGFVAACLRSLLLLGVPLHPRCLPLAAWAGSREILEVISISQPSGQFSPRELLIWAARGAYVNPHRRQEEVVRWLLTQRANVEERDQEGWSMLEWACWSGAETLVALALRAGLSPSGVQHGRTVCAPLALAVASRSPNVVGMLLRAACDPHVPPSSAGCGALLLAVQRGEYGLGCQIMQGAPFVAIDAALSPIIEQSFNVEEDGSMKAFGTTQATVVIIDSFRRFARAMVPRSGEETTLAMLQSGVRNLPTLGAHPEEGLYVSGKAHLSGLQHPLIMELPKPKFKVGHEFRPQVPPHWWMQKSSTSAWRTAYNFIECCCRSGFRPDGAVISQALPMLPADAKRIVQHMVMRSTAGGASDLGAHAFDTIRALRQFKLNDLDDSPHRIPNKLERSPEAEWNQATRKVPLFPNSDDILPERVAETLEHCLNDYGQLHQEETEVPVHFEEQPSHYNGIEHDASQDFQSGPWNASVLNETLMQKSDTKAASSLPSLRVVILGSPRVGKTHVARCLYAALGMSSPTETCLELAAPAWLTTQTGFWPAGQQPRLMVNIWDGSTAPLPGLHGKLAADPATALLLVWVSDAELAGAAQKAAASVTECLEAANTTSGAAPRRALLVENIFSGTASPPNATKNVKSSATCNVVRGSLQATEGIAGLKSAFSAACEDIVGELASKPQSATSIGNVMPQLQCAKDAPRLTAALRGDAALWDPRSVTWAWAAVQSSMGFLTEPATPGFLNEGYRGHRRCDGAVISMERLAGVLSMPGVTNAADGHAGAARAASVAAQARALADVGLVCPIPCVVADAGKDVAQPHPRCKYALVPDFARRSPLTSTQVAHMVGNGSSGSSGKQAERRKELTSARILWDSPGSSAPSLRSFLRDFLARGVIAVGGNMSNARSIDVCQFSLLEKGHNGDASRIRSDDLAPGFLLVFDLVSASALQSPKSDRSVSGGPIAKPPSSVKASTPSGAGQEDRKVSASGHPATDDTANMVPSHLTTLIVVVSDGATSAGKNSERAPFWDVYCSGPHSQWAWRSFFGTGTCGPSFASFERLQQTKSKTAVDPALPLPLPMFSISGKASNAGAARTPPSGGELLALLWMFNGPQGAGVRSQLYPQEEEIKASSIAACCAALCGKSNSPAPIDMGGNGSNDSQEICADFEASFSSRNWRMASRYLDEALASGVESWIFCGMALARAVRDTAAAAAGNFGRALPLLASDQSVAAEGTRSISLVLEGPSPIVAGAVSSQNSLRPLGKLRAASGLDAWLRLCRPAALWSNAGGARGFQAANELQSAIGIHGIGTQVSEALQTAMTVRLSEEHVSEVWDALSESISSGRLARRGDGSWTTMVDTDSLLL